MALPHARIGQLLGDKYRLQELLALGGMGIVFGGRHLATGRSVAVKLLRSELLTEPEIVRRVSLEARLAVEAAHPNVVDVLDAGADEAGVPYLVLERLFGQPLDALLTAPLSLRTTTQALIPIVNALSALHRAGIVHRDVKPSNIFLSVGADRRVTPKLLDFGLAKAVAAGASTLSGVALGTPAYMAPEQALGFGAAGPAADVWAMGVVFVRCLTGDLPFAGATAETLTLRVGLGPEALRGVPEPVARVLSRALRLEPAERQADMLEFRSELELALAGLEAGVPWPDAGTVNYASGESELEALLARALPRPESEAAASVTPTIQPRGARDSLTRTLPNLARGAAQRSRRWLTGASLLLAGGAGTTWLVVRNVELAESAPEAAPPVAALFAPRPTAPPRLEVPETPGAVASAAALVSDVAPSANRPAKLTIRAAQASAAAAPSAAVSIAPREPPAPVGANRSPIIE